MSINIEKKVYRNITEQVAKNTNDIEKYKNIEETCTALKEECIDLRNESVEAKNSCLDTKNYLDEHFNLYIHNVRVIYTKDVNANTSHFLHTTFKILTTSNEEINTHNKLENNFNKVIDIKGFLDVRDKSVSPNIDRFKVIQNIYMEEGYINTTYFDGNNLEDTSFQNYNLSTISDNNPEKLI